MYVRHVTSYSVHCQICILNAADQADDVLFDDDGQATNDEEEILEEFDADLSDEGM